MWVTRAVVGSTLASFLSHLLHSSFGQKKGQSGPCSALFSNISILFVPSEGKMMTGWHDLKIVGSLTIIGLKSHPDFPVNI